MRYLSDLQARNLQGKICLLRLDFNTEYNWRLEASVPTIKFLMNHCQAVVILSHRGRPKRFEKKLSLKSLTKTLHKILQKPVTFIPHFRFLEIKELVEASPKGSVFLLENLRFLDGEAKNSSALSEHLAMLGHIYVNDAFAVSHRAEASVAGITKFIRSYVGLELEKEIRILSGIRKNPEKPLVIIIGGVKIIEKLSIFNNLKNEALVFLIGGALDEKILTSDFSKLIFPVDFKREQGGSIRDIGSKSVRLFNNYIKKAGTIIWNGPLGNVEKKQFSGGTRAVARAVVRNKKAYTVIGGGETVMFFKKMKLDKKIDFISTGGGAMLEFLAGKKLPGIAALEDESCFVSREREA